MNLPHSPNAIEKDVHVPHKLRQSIRRRNRGKARGVIDPMRRHKTGRNN